MRTLFSYASYYSTKLQNIVEYREQIKEDSKTEPDTKELFKNDKEIFMSQEEETSKGVWTVKSHRALSEDEIEERLRDTSIWVRDIIDAN